jgi:TatD DNase family protein
MSNDYVIVDCGANLSNKKFQRDLDNVLERAETAGVKKLVVLSSSAKSSREALRLTRLYPGTLFCAAGIHPLESQSWNRETEATFEEILSKQECVGVGICGLDQTKLDVAPLAQQKEVLESQIKMSTLRGKTCVIFEKSSHNDLVKVVRSYPDANVVVHGFCGSTDQAKEYIHNGFYLSMTGALWKQKEDFQKLLRDPLVQDRLLLASDAPFLFPNAKSKLKRSQENNQENGDKEEAIFSEVSESLVRRYCSFQRNEPCSLALTCELLAHLTEQSPHDAALKTTYNALNVFKLNF